MVYVAHGRVNWLVSLLDPGWFAWIMRRVNLLLVILLPDSAWLLLTHRKGELLNVFKLNSKLRLGW